MSGKLVGSAIVLLALVVGASIYYLQVYGFYREVALSETPEMSLVLRADGSAQAIELTDFRAIDAESSPIRFRACFTTGLTPDEAKTLYVTAPNVPPRNAPGWFDCFDAAEIAASIDAGTMITFLGVKNIAYGVDRIIGLGANGQGVAWHTLNECGTKAYDGTIVGEECPPRPGSGGVD